MTTTKQVTDYDSWIARAQEEIAPDDLDVEKTVDSGSRPERPTG